ncbi:hypothetical protein ASPZODRAFT_19459 [Penicilliopsis zonata CBS 506.65]|uniref:Serum paraoxonase/arylesterase family protein n=1 Tax=Penicilliopsis zonata CBS 506.65 TaxID=1073090 RepID=A0A1L9S888_9EURO|nr:hypothetical protein ASPZODRAFT_19459 [Penicilliopsis zonata CBS 506.65]OJJ43373.1 hypothetical protein ASPZODRAFT_19459 [Penicilliopsis zonata CBS 506.65]
MKSVTSLAIVALVLATACIPIHHRLTVAGVFRHPRRAAVSNLVRIADTVHCEDLHFYEPANLLFTACEDIKTTRFKWFPPLAIFDEPLTARGSIHVIEPEAKSTRLEFENFSGPFSTHGIDVIADPDREEAVYIFAVNHQANAETEEGIPKASSQIELFHHVLGTTRVRHVRSMRHESITTPNDIYAWTPSSFLVTNDHFYRDGAMRTVEDVVTACRWTNIIHVQIEEMHSLDATGGIRATEALRGLHNNNGLGHGAGDEEVLVSDSGGGVFYRAVLEKPETSTTGVRIRLVESIRMDSSIDNPTYYRDPYGTNASGYILAGLSRSVDLARSSRDPSATEPVMVWYLRRGDAGWDKHLIFEDDGSTIRSAATAVLVPRAGAVDGRQAWLFVTGFLSESIVAVSVDLL